MPVSMYTVSIPVFIQHLNGLNTVLDKATAWAAARKVNEVDLLNMRLSPDMFNLARQIRAATDHAANAAGRLSGKELLKFANDETTIAQLKERIAKTIDYLKSVQQSEIDGTEDKEISITFPSGQTRQFTGQSQCLATVCPISGFTPLPPTTSSGSAASRSASATSWAPPRHSDIIPCAPSPSPNTARAGLIRKGVFLSQLAAESKLESKLDFVGQLFGSCLAARTDLPLLVATCAPRTCGRSYGPAVSQTGEAND